ncbi:Clp protease N-terminal domain-containing protein [Actinopolymorpha alba]|uniref:Clp protease N-terminal domain-containing protein n=1 Tax=Actinopolymorpha alba TaxID=533267 RepID=UPI00036E9E86|nr:Clp protease N-terminal domain-containing protein [Actinopolymorpha alba]
MADNDLDLDQIIAAIESAQAEGAPLDRVTAARDVAARLETLAQHVVAHFVDQSRQSGASWTDIGGALGVTRQAAQQRFVPADGVDVEAVINKPAIPYTARASAALTAARDLAAEHHHESVEDIHLLLVLLDNRTGGAIGVVKGLGQRAADIRKAAKAVLPPDGPRRAKSPVLGRTAVKALDVATREALRLKSPEVGTEHELLALVSDPQSLAGQTLAQTGATYDGVRTEVAKQAAAGAERAAQKRTRRKRA